MRVWVEPEARKEINRLPGHVRQRIRRTIQSLSSDPYPPKSRVLTLSDETKPIAGVQICRLRIDRWRIIYAVDAPWQMVIILAVRRRPPYNYEDLADLLASLG